MVESDPGCKVVKPCEGRSFSRVARCCSSASDNIRSIRSVHESNCCGCCACDVDGIADGSCTSGSGSGSIASAPRDFNHSGQPISASLSSEAKKKDGSSSC